ncbi:MAG TPA: ABC transporter permease [Bryobacteraceae bacterium]|nr:ABC transporter permease [Bryobacteraceae bacterium]
MLRRSPVFTLTVVLTLALGIGANTAIFTIVNSVMLRPLPYRDPGRLVAVWDTYQPNVPKLGVSPTEYDEWRRLPDIFEEIGRYRYVAIGKESNLTGGAEPLRVQPTCASSSLFPMLGVRPLLGRLFQPEDDADNAPPIAILGNRLWREYFHADPKLVGAPIQLNGQAYTVVGVLPPDFRLPAWADLWLPQGQAGDEVRNPVRHSFAVIARLKDNVSLRQASARLESIAQRLEREHPKTSKGFGVTVDGLQQDMAGNIRPALLVLLAAVTVVLLIACVNVANLLLSRAATRKRELAIRIALGAGRWRIAQQSLAESMRLSFAGGAAGLALAYVGLDLLLRLAPPNLIDPAAIHIDTVTLAFTFAVSLATGALFGIAPALEAARQDPSEGLKESGRSFTHGSGAERSTLVIAEFALALLLLMGAGLLIQSFARLMHVNPGFQPANVLTARVQLSPNAHPDEQKLEAFYERLVARLQSLPGVKAVAATNALPLAGNRASSTRFTVPGAAAMAGGVLPAAQLHLITPDYFRTLGIVLRGRTYNSQDLNQPFVIINETMARTFWPSEDPIGKRFVTGPWGPNPSWSTVIAVAADVKQFGLDSERTNDIYFLDYGMKYLMIQASTSPLPLAPAVRREIQALDPAAPVSDFITMEQVLDASTGPRRFSTLLLSIFAAVALALAVIGIYGIMSWSVGQRRQEIGIRMAVGADGPSILRLILGRGLKLACAGLAIGLGASPALTRLLSTLLFEISPHDPWILGSVSLFMLAVTTAACYLPARRAMRVDPVDTLRSE